MFMEMSEFKNAAKLMKIRNMNERKKGFLFIAGTFIFLSLVSLVPAIIWMLRESSSHLGRSITFRISDYSIGPGIGLVIGISILNCTYRIFNQNYAVYPQTNNSRFLFYQLNIHLLIASVPSIMAILYLIQYGICYLIAAGRSNIHFVYDFDIRFVLSGYMVYIVYVAILGQIVTLIGVLCRKFKIYAAVFFVALIGLIFSNVSVAFKVFKALFGFLLFEDRLGMFLLKGLALWAGLFVVSTVINRYTVYYKSAYSESKQSLISGIAAALVLVMIVAGLPLMLLMGQEKVIKTEESDQGENPFFQAFEFPEPQEIEFDISNLAKGSSIDIASEGSVAVLPDSDDIVSSGFTGRNIQYYEYADGSWMEYPKDYIVISEGDSLNNIQGEKLIVHYQYPYMIESNEDIGKYLNPKIEADLVDNTLHLSYHFDKDAKALFISIWPFMWQFDDFQGRHLFQNSIIGSNARSFGSIWISIE